MRHPKPYVKKAVPLSDVLQRVLTQGNWRKELNEARLRREWAEIVGPEIAARAQPVEIFRGRLLIHCEHDVWRTELTYLKPELLQRIAEVMGEGFVKEIWLK
jgi:predicted nucleic acid-binding Zn ribbon protein